MKNKAIRTLGMRLKEARMNADYSQEEVAEAIGIHAVTVSKYERDAQDPNTKALAALAKFLNVSVDWLITEHEDIIHHNPMDHEAAMKTVMSYPSVVMRITEGTLSQEAIADINEYVQFVQERDRRRRNKR